MSRFGEFGWSFHDLESQRQMESELQRGEKVLWIGQPRPGRVMLSTLPIFLFGIPWTAFAVFWVGMALFLGGGVAKGPDPGAGRWLSLCFPLFGVPFVLVGLGMLSAPWWARRRAKRSCYAVTNQRAIVRQAGVFGGVAVRSFGPDQLLDSREEGIAELRDSVISSIYKKLVGDCGRLVTVGFRQEEYLANQWLSAWCL
jgi:hypothetical protein